MNSTTCQELEPIVGQVLATNIVTFTEDEFIEDGIGYIKSLHIIVECKGMIIIITRVLIDYNLTLNICLLTTINRVLTGPL